MKNQVHQRKMVIFEVSLDIQDANHCAAFPAYGIQGIIELDLWIYGPLLALALAGIHSFFEDFWRSVGKADVVWLRNLFIEYSWACIIEVVGGLWDDIIVLYRSAYS